MYIWGLHDDLYFAKAAHTIIHGEWLGAYDQMTLIKNPFYAFFLILSFGTGLPLFFNESIFYVVACILIFIAFIPLIKNPWWRMFLFSLLLFCPESMTTAWNLRIYREFIYFSLTLYVVASSIGLFLRLDKNIFTLLLWSILLGMSMGAFMLTREEGVWIYPPLILILSISIFWIWKKKYEKKILRSCLVLMPILIWYIPIFVVSAINYSHYGFWGTTEQLDPDFNRVLIILDRIETDDDTWHPAIQIPKSARLKAYTASPILNSMRDDIEYLVAAWNISDDLAMELKNDWYLDQYGDGGSEIGSHFLWLFRDVVCQNGHCKNATATKEFYKQLADQLEVACDDGTLVCSSTKAIPFVGLIDQRHYPIISRMFLENILSILNLDYFGMVTLDVLTWPSLPENSEDYKYFDEFAYNPIDYLKLQINTNDLYIVNGNMDLRLRILSIKENIIGKIAKFYKDLINPGFIITFISWIFIMVISLFKKQLSDQITFFIITLYLMSLMMIRVMTLTIVDSTTSAAGSIYSASNFIFVYIFIGTVSIRFLIGLIQTLKHTVIRNNGN